MKSRWNISSSKAPDFRSRLKLIRSYLKLALIMCKITFWDSLKKHWHILYKFFNLFEVAWRLKKCLCHLLHSEVISFFVTRECQKIRKINQNKWCNWRGKSSYLLNDLRNFKEIFRKDVTRDNIKSHRKPELQPLSLFLSLSLSHSFSEKFILGKRGGSNWPPGRFRVKMSRVLNTSCTRF